MSVDLLPELLNGLLASLPAADVTAPGNNTISPAAMMMAPSRIDLW